MNRRVFRPVVKAFLDLTPFECTVCGRTTWWLECAPWWWICATCIAPRFRIHEAEWPESISDDRP